MGIVKQENIDTCKTKFSFTFDKEKVENLANEIAADISKKYTVKGFRKGRCDLQSVKLSAKAHILDNIKQKLITEAYEDILFESGVKPFGQPTVSDMKVTLNSFSADLIIGYAPPFELGQYKDLEIIKPNDLPQTEVISDRLKEKLCEQHGILVPFCEDDFLLVGDSTVINYQGTIDGLPFDNCKAEGVVVNVGSNTSVEWFEDQLIGAKPGETREFELSFKDDFSVKDLAGKTVLFKVDILSASRKTPATYDEELAKTLELSTLEELEERVQAQAKDHAQNYVFNMVRGQVLTKLLQLNPIDIPMWQVVEIAKQLANQNQLDWNTVEDQIRAQLLMEAQNKIKLSFLFERIKDTEAECLLSTEELLSILNANIMNFPENVRKELEKGTNFELFQRVFTEIQDQHIAKWLVNHCKMVDQQQNLQDQTTQALSTETQETQVQGE